ncbi:hypothetical protein CEUSTIGMA_g12453.t1 [Chlamydomonas eustigma]|uniref:ADP-ribosylglycohydrolase n=1 Tax=Chlamydomonas eustigma TaxID=1157962 RepID=A0A250XPV0_9CHLO|nr:hypothetical protein CEUSTIGMA_g12453.t1 [Chlamydomonas eustigma]|eukprot:GAX85033.1 hypothetical protein CEUSTIGMA_g12453.t1 [Chlamydomonas eustigma]
MQNSFVTRSSPRSWRQAGQLKSPTSQSLNFAFASVTQPRTVKSLAISTPEISAMTNLTPAALDRLRGCLWGVFIADALSMPVHWYYDTNVLQRDFGYITDYQAPKVRHPGSIMSVSNTGGHGRGDQSGKIIGDVINHGKHPFWGKPGVHYHQGMKAGENTLNALCSRVVIRDIAARGSYDSNSVLSAYIKFMTTPGSHNDTYAESFHRDFFGNWVKGVPPEQCSRGTEGHNTAQIGGFVMLPPVIMSQLGKGVEVAKQQAMKQLTMTHESKKLAGFTELYIDLLYRLAFEGVELQPALSAVAQKHLNVDLKKLVDSNYDDIRVVHSVFGSACYIEDSFPSMLYMAYKYADSFEKAVLTNTNVGGENCHRGAALGALMGAALGESKIPTRFIEGLHDKENIKKEIDSFVAALFPTFKEL